MLTLVKYYDSSYCLHNFSPFAGIVPLVSLISLCKNYEFVYEMYCRDILLLSVKEIEFLLFYCHENPLGYKFQ